MNGDAFLAYVRQVLAPTLPLAALLAVLSYDALFLGTVVGFLGSAALVVSVLLPAPQAEGRRPFRERVTKGIRIYLATPRLRGLLALNLAVAGAGAMVLVNTVVLVRSGLGMAESAVALTMGAFGAGSMAAALSLPRLLDRVPDRPVMLTGAAAMIAALLGLAGWITAAGLSWPALLVAWVAAGLGSAAVQTPAGRLLRRSAHPEDRPALFAAQFALSHACWLVAYPLAGALMTVSGAGIALLGLAGLAGAGLAAALAVWPVGDPVVIKHRHDDLPAEHPHIREGRAHAHPYIIDAHHRQWPLSTRD